MTPEDVAREIRIAQGHARREVADMMQNAVRHLSATAGDLGRWVEQARTADLQNLRLMQVGIAALLVGGTVGLIVGTKV